MIFRRLFPSLKKKADLSVPIDASDNRFLAEIDPELFKAVFDITDSDQRAHVLKKRPHDALFFDILKFGMRWDVSQIDPVRERYSAAVNVVPLEVRQEMRQIIRKFLIEGGLSAHALIPMLCEEPDRFIVSNAVADFLEFAPVLDNDPMERVREIIQFMEEGVMLNPGAAFGGLLHFGNRDICNLIWPLKDRLSTGQVLEGVMSYTGVLSAACVEFEIAWLEQIDPADSKLFAAVAFALRAQRLAAPGREIATGTRKFPLSYTDPDEIVAFARPMLIDEYAKTIAPRLHALAQVVPLVMPDVASAWGIELPPVEQGSKRPTVH